ncbi:hypothetical protein [Actinacidiphila bryophytorum]|uniref:hypothetical protein n=1 Tax=Actinacidiphila bryophytorum TaxID=1436133 RepID=UPI00196090A6|nr:hypothetical protein [Actinacidiphila bryophytorum]MBM9434426.1 hypothetical protein [Actinacidiphila bryophytorum]MBN6541900.1 hypothetical protein [Actinacidiphila bryophytorum]
MSEFLVQATKDPRVMTRLQDELDILDEAQRARMRHLMAMGGHAFIAADVSDLEGEEAYAIAEVDHA